MWCGFQYLCKERMTASELVFAKFCDVCTHPFKFCVCGVCGGQRESLLHGSAFLQVDIKEQEWVSWESVGRGGEAIKNVLISCLFSRPGGHCCTRDCVESTSGVLRLYIHLLSSALLRNFHESHSDFDHFLFIFLFSNFLFVFFHFMLSKLLSGRCLKSLVVILWRWVHRSKWVFYFVKEMKTVQSSIHVYQSLLLAMLNLLCYYSLQIHHKYFSFVYQIDCNCMYFYPKGTHCFGFLFVFNVLVLRASSYSQQSSCLFWDFMWLSKRFLDNL